jgi:hypothetical protein
MTVSELQFFDDICNDNSKLLQRLIALKLFPFECVTCLIEACPFCSGFYRQWLIRYDNRAQMCLIAPFFLIVV